MDTVFIANNINDYVKKSCPKNPMNEFINKIQYITNSKKRNDLIISTISNELKNNTNNILIVCDTINQMEIFNKSIENSYCIRIPKFTKVTLLEEKTRVFIVLNQPEFLFYDGDVLEKNFLKKFNVKTCIYTSVKNIKKWEFLEKYGFKKLIHLIDIICNDDIKLSIDDIIII